jgi:hypothetical protein
MYRIEKMKKRPRSNKIIIDRKFLTSNYPRKPGITGEEHDRILVYVIYVA